MKKPPSDPRKTSDNAQDEPLSRREFIAKSATSIVNVTVAGVATSSLLSAQAGAQELKTPLPQTRTPLKTQAAPAISPSVQRVLELGARDPQFRKELTSNPTKAVQDRKIKLSPSDLRTLESVIGEAQMPGGSERFGCMHNMECGYRGY